MVRIGAGVVRAGLAAVFAAASWLAPVAQAQAAHITVSVRPRVLMVGDNAEIQGSIRGPASVSSVALERLVDGTWQPLRSRHVGADHRFSFVVRPPRGHPTYRVVGGHGRAVSVAVSDPVTLTVRWRPELTVAAVWHTTDDGGRELIVSAHSSYRGVGRLHFEQKYAGQSWIGAGHMTLHDGSFSGVAHIPVRPGNLLRATLPRSGPRLESQSASIRVGSPEPYRLVLDDPAGLVLPYRQQLTTVLIDAEAGDLVTLWFDGWVIEWPTVLDPDGVSVPASTAPARFEATKTGTYTVTFWAMDDLAGPVTVTAYTPKEYAGEWGTPVSVAPDFPYQPVDVVFQGTAGEAFATPPAGYVPEVRDAAGALAPWVQVGSWGGYRLQADGPVTYRILDGGPHQVLVGRGRVATTTVDGPRVPLDLSGGTTFAVVTVDVEPGQAFLMDTEQLYDSEDWVLLGPDGAATPWRLEDPTPGTYTFAVFGRSCPACSIQLGSPYVVESPLDAGPTSVSLSSTGTRWIWQTFTAVEGDLVTMDATSTMGEARPGELRTPAGLPAVSEGRRLWRIPSSGTWQHRFDAFSWDGTLSAEHVTPVDLPFDGTPTVVTIAEPHGVRVLHIDAPVGSQAQVSIDQVADSLSGSWMAEIYAPDGYWYRNAYGAGTIPSFTVSQPGGLDIIISGSLWSPATGSMTITATAQ